MNAEELNSAKKKKKKKKKTTITGAFFDPSAVEHPRA